MKRLYFTSLCVIVVVAGTAQTRITRTVVRNSNESLTRQIAVNAVLTNGCDTVSNILSTDTAMVYGLESPDWGSPNGHNNYEDKSKVEKFLSTSYTAGYKVVAGFMFIAKAIDGAIPTTMQARVWDASGTGGLPNTQLGSVNLAIASMATGGTLTIVNFVPPVAVSGDFYFGLDGFVYQTTQEDTVAIFSTAEDTQQSICHAHDQFSDGSWHAWEEAPPTNWGIKAGLYMGVILCDAASGQVEIKNQGADVIVYPNPATSVVYVSTGTLSSGKVTITVYDVMGKLVSSSNQAVQCGATYKVDLNGAAAGVYSVNVITDGKSISRKLIIE